MIDWTETEKRFGYSKQETKNDMAIIALCDNCHDSFELKKSSYSRTLRRRKSDKYLCHKCATSNKQFKEKCSENTKKQWNDKNKRENLLKSLNSEEYKKKSSLISKKLWKDKEYVKKIKDVYATEENKKSRRETSIKMWKDKKYRDRVNEQYYSNDEYLDRLSNKMKSISLLNKEKRASATKKLWMNDDFRNKVINSRKQSYNDERKMKKSEFMKKLWENEEFRGKMTVARSQQPRVSSIQTILYSILDDLNVKYYREYEDKPNDPETVIGYYNFDCVIPRDDKPDLLIECQGDYWHSQDKAIRNDKSKSTYIKKYFPQYELKYLWEHEFSCKEKIVEVVKYWLDITGTELIDFNFKDVDIRSKVKSDEYKLLLSKYHYLSNAGRGGRVYGAYFNNELIAVCIFSPLVRQNIRTNGYDPGECLELSRFCVHPRYQKKNFGSWFISKCFRLLDSKYKLIISYCDKTFNHDGALYKACNFKEDGIIKPDYWYVDDDNYVMHKRTLYGRAVKMSMKESYFAEQYGYRRVYGDEKIRFIYERL